MGAPLMRVVVSQTVLVRSSLGCRVMVVVMVRP